MATTYTYDPDTPIGHLRFLTDDRDMSAIDLSLPLEQRSAVFSDQELAMILYSPEVGGNIKLAAAAVLLAFAANSQLLVQSRRILDTHVNYGSIRGDLMKLAQTYRDQAIAEGGTLFGPASATVEQSWTTFNRDRMVINAALRQWGG